MIEEGGYFLCLFVLHYEELQCKKRSTDNSKNKYVCIHHRCDTCLTLLSYEKMKLSVMHVAPYQEPLLYPLVLEGRT